MLGMRACGGVRKMGFSALMIFVAACAAATVLALPAGASIHHRHWQRWQASRKILNLTEPEKDAALVLDGETGKSLFAHNADELRHPASLTKMMTLYMLFEQLKSGQMTLATPLSVSEHAAVQARTKLYLRPGSAIPVDTAIKAVVVLSANDVAVAIAEAIGGTEARFAQMMTAKAHELGMTHTNYDNASGLPDPLQITTADDLAILARHLAYDYPQYFHYFSTYSFSYRGATFFTHDNLIGRYEGADGIKTGYTNASGFNLVSSVVRNGVHIIGVVMGGTTARRRDSEMVHLLDDTFAAIGKNPQLVARAEIPWQAIAQNGEPKPVIAGFQLGGSGTPLASVPAQSGQARVTPAGSDDEDAAESRPDPLFDLDSGRQKAPRQDESSSRPTASPTGPLPPKAPAPVVLASLAPLPAPPARLQLLAAWLPGAAPLPEPKPSLSVADLESRLATPEPRDARAANQYASAGSTEGYWTVQIGAFGDATLARAKLAAYADRSHDILGQSSRIVAPFQSADGHTLYRARFGPFIEHDARQVCEALTRRGQTCFAAVASR